MVSSDFGQLAVSRHLTSGMDCATAGAASADAALPAAPNLRNFRGFIGMFLLLHRSPAGGGIRPPRGGFLGVAAPGGSERWGERWPPRRDRRKGEGPRQTGHLACDVDVKLHLRMDAAEHEKRACGGEVDFDRLARLLGAGIEVEA